MTGCFNMNGSFARVRHLHTPRDVTFHFRCTHHLPIQSKITSSDYLFFSFVLFQTICSLKYTLSPFKTKSYPICDHRYLFVHDNGNNALQPRDSSELFSLNQLSGTSIGKLLIFHDQFLLVLKFSTSRLYPTLSRYFSTPILSAIKKKFF